MATKLFRITRLISASRPAAPALNFKAEPTKAPALSNAVSHRTFVSTARAMAVTVDSNFISRITAAEKQITNQDEPVAGGPTAQAQSHVNQPLTSQVVHDITMGERKITGLDGPVPSGPTSVAQSILTASGPSQGGNASGSSRGSSSNSASGVLDSETISKITEKEKHLTGQDNPVRGGPTAQAQKHTGEPITSEALHDITEGEKKITGGERVKGGPTSKAQSELGKSRQQ